MGKEELLAGSLDFPSVLQKYIRACISGKNASPLPSAAQPPLLRAPLVVPLPTTVMGRAAGVCLVVDMCFLFLRLITALGQQSFLLLLLLKTPLSPL